MYLTSGYELTTSITNIFIFVVSIICFFKIKKNNLWKFFFLLMSIDSFLGVIVHGIVMSQKTNDILWVILSLCFTFTVNTLFCLFLNLKHRHIVILSILLSTLLLTQMIYGFDYLLTFTLYVLIIILICIYYSLKNKLYLIGFLIQIIGGILMLCKCKISIINHNGICHIFMAIALIFLYLGSKKDIKI